MYILQRVVGDVHVRLVWAFRVLRPLPQRRLIILYYAKLKIDFYSLPLLPPPHKYT